MAVTKIRGSSQIIDASILNAQISASAAIALSKLEAVTNGDIIIGDGSNVAAAVTPSGDVTLSNAGVFGIASGVIVDGDINALAAIAFDKLAALTDGNILVGDGSNDAVSVSPSGDVTLANDGTFGIATGAVVNADVNASAGIELSKLESVTSANFIVGNGSAVATAVAMSGDISLANDGTTAIASGVIVNADIKSDAAIAYSKLATLSSGNILVGSAGNVATSVNPTGDIDISNTGVFSIASGVIVDDDINASAAIALSKLAEAVIQADGGQAFTANQAMGGFKLTGLGTPGADGDAVTKAYVDAAIEGLDIHGPADYGTDAALPAVTAAGSGAGKTLTADGNGVLSVDDNTTWFDIDTDSSENDVTLPLGAGAGKRASRVLVKDQVNDVDNGVYAVQDKGTAGTPFILVRYTDFDGTPTQEVHNGDFLFITMGTANGSTGWIQTEVDPITVDTDAINFTQFSSAGEILAGAGMTKSGNTLNVIAADQSLTVNTDDMQVKLDATAGTLEVGGAGIQIADGTAGQILIGKGASTDTAFTAISGDITLGSDGTVAIATGVIVNADVKSDAAIAYNKLAALTSASILVGNGSNVATVTAVTGDISISNTGVTAIGSGVIVNADVNASAAIAFDKLAALTDGNILVGDSGNDAVSVSPSGDVTLSNAGVFGIASDVIVNADIKSDAAIAYSKLATLSDGNLLVGNVSNVAASVNPSGDINISNTGVFSIASGAVVNADVNASAAIDFSKLATLTSANILVGSAGNVATAVSVSGDIGMTNAGVVSLTSGAVVNDDVNASAAIDFSKLASLTGANILVGSAGNVATSVTMSGDATLSNAGVLTLATAVVKDADIITREVPTGLINSANVTYTLANTPVAGSEHVYLNGVLQDEGASDDYQITGDTITYNTAPTTGDKLCISYRK